ncbi:DnaD domain protein [Halobacillus shinanisalinarum]|uniref:DnaD domain protein n=1 Tax=Halobacillus shinanisalinarum TaxID=2932258 RepID=A0ABY4H331_9BACI|nr:DnaD domain protein [Halobacillus shinanisalinarum]UOQ94764.1 DnaD domain protein [Halobacillus shinanisalinarum]
MNYLKETIAFYDQVDLKQLSSSAVALWGSLMYINNKTGWKKEFTVPASVLRGKSGLRDSSFKLARKELDQKGFIRYKSGNWSQAPSYQMVSIKSMIDQETDYLASYSTDESPDHPGDQLASPLFKQNKIKQKEVVVGARSPHAFYEQNIGMLTPFIAEKITQWCKEMSDDLVVEAMKMAIGRNKLFFQYCEGILNRWQKRGVRTLQAAKAVERDSRKRPPRLSKKEENRSIFDKLREEEDVWITEKH